MRGLSLLTSVCAAAVALYTTGARAEASLAACGDITIEANAACEVIPPSAECMTMCTPFSVQATCAAELTVNCDGQCEFDASVDCTGSCSGGCLGQCEADPGSFDCSATCQATCSADCMANCTADPNEGRCEASCRANCSASCDADCDIDAPSVDCNAQCEACCSGSCTAEANLDCQVSCQTDAYAGCEVDIQGGCEVSCMGDKGALFCDGQFIDHNNNLENCVAGLRDKLNIEVSGYADASCMDGTCMAEAGVSLGGCSAGPAGRRSSVGVLALLVLLVVGGWRRRFA